MKKLQEFLAFAVLLAAVSLIGVLGKSDQLRGVRSDDDITTSCSVPKNIIINIVNRTDNCDSAPLPNYYMKFEGACTTNAPTVQASSHHVEQPIDNRTCTPNACLNWCKEQGRDDSISGCYYRNDNNLADWLSNRTVQAPSGYKNCTCTAYRTKVLSATGTLLSDESPRFDDNLNLKDETCWVLTFNPFLYYTIHDNESNHFWKSYDYDGQLSGKKIGVLAGGTIKLTPNRTDLISAKSHWRFEYIPSTGNYRIINKISGLYVKPATESQPNEYPRWGETNVQPYYDGTTASYAHLHLPEQSINEDFDFEFTPSTTNTSNCSLTWKLTQGVRLTDGHFVDTFIDNASNVYFGEGDRVYYSDCQRTNLHYFCWHSDKEGYAKNICDKQNSEYIGYELCGDGMQGCRYLTAKCRERLNGNDRQVKNWIIKEAPQVSPNFQDGPGIVVNPPISRAIPRWGSYFVEQAVKGVGDYYADRLSDYLSDKIFDKDLIYKYKESYSVGGRIEKLTQYKNLVGPHMDDMLDGRTFKKSKNYIKYLGKLSALVALTLPLGIVTSIAMDHFFVDNSHEKLLEYIEDQMERLNCKIHEQIDYEDKRKIEEQSKVYTDKYESGWRSFFGNDDGVANLQTSPKSYSHMSIVARRRKVYQDIPTISERHDLYETISEGMIDYYKGVVKDLYTKTVETSNQYTSKLIASYWDETLHVLVDQMLTWLQETAFAFAYHCHFTHPTFTDGTGFSQFETCWNCTFDDFLNGASGNAGCKLDFTAFQDIFETTLKLKPLAKENIRSMLNDLGQPEMDIDNNEYTCSGSDGRDPENIVECPVVTCYSPDYVIRDHFYETPLLTWTKYSDRFGDTCSDTNICPVNCRHITHENFNQSELEARLQRLKDEREHWFNSFYLLTDEELTFLSYEPGEPNSNHTAENNWIKYIGSNFEQIMRDPEKYVSYAINQDNALAGETRYTRLPTNAPTSSPTLTPTNAPTSSPTFDCNDTTHRHSVSIQIASGSEQHKRGYLPAVNVDHSDGCILWGCYQLQALIKFPLITPRAGGPEIAEAKLFLYTTSPVGANKPKIQMYQREDYWNENTTWATHSHGRENAPPHEFLPLENTRNQYYEIEVTDHVKSWVNGEKENFGWLFKTLSTDGWTFETNLTTADDRKPYLTIKYSC